MTAKHILPKDIAFFPETTPCEGPADWTGVDVYPFEFISCDLSGVKEMLVVDPTAERRTWRVGERARVPGPRNVTSSLVLKLHGIGVETPSASQVPDTYLAKFLKHCMGAVVRGTSTVISGPGTSTVPIVSSVTGIVAGVMLGFEDTTSPTEQDEGIVHFRRVVSVNGGTKAVTLSGELPFTPADGDKVHGCITASLLHSYLIDAVTSGGLLQYYVKLDQGTADDDLIWTLEGSVASFKVENISRGGLPQLTLDIQAANFRHGATDGLNNVALGTREGHAQLCCGTHMRMFISPVGSTDEIEVDANEVTFDVGMTRKPVPTVTSRIYRFDGLATYAYDPGASYITTKLVNYEESWYAALRAGDEYRLTWYQPGDGTGAGKGWCIHGPRARLVETPARADIDQVHGVTLKWQLVEADDAGTTDLAQSRFLIALA